MRKIITVILDPAHGSDVKGKSSPDGRHREYQWSRMISKMLEEALVEKGYTVAYTTKSDIEIGLTKRKQNADNQVIGKGNIKLLLSNHNNAAGSDGKWHTARGCEIWTSKGKTLSDLFADELFRGLHTEFPEGSVVKYRYGDPSTGNKDKDENFTVLMGGSYYACLIEWLFQDNQDDVAMLQDPKCNEKYVKAIVQGVEYINEYAYSKLNK